MAATARWQRLSAAGRMRALWLSLFVLLALAGCGPPGPVDYRSGPYDNDNHGPASP